MQAPGFWDDQETAARTSAEHSSVSRRLHGFRELERDVGDLETLEEMAAEDESMAAELEEQMASIDRSGRRWSGVSFSTTGTSSFTRRRGPAGKPATRTSATSIR